jgi:hypothetical protein
MLSARAQAAAARCDRESTTARTNDPSGPATRRAIDGVDDDDDDDDDDDAAAMFGTAIFFPPPPPPPPPPRGKAVAIVADIPVGDGRFPHAIDDEGGHVIEEASAEENCEGDNAKMMTMIAARGRDEEREERADEALLRLGGRSWEGGRRRMVMVRVVYSRVCL